MEPTKLVVRGREANGNYAVTNKDGVQGKVFYEEIQTLERANRFVRCWNCHDELLEACEGFVAGWTHYLDCIDFGKSYLDAEAIQFMNEIPGQIAQAIAAAESE